MSDDQPDPPAGLVGDRPVGEVPLEPAPLTAEPAENVPSTRTARKLVYLVPAGVDSAGQDERSLGSESDAADMGDELDADGHSDGDGDGDGADDGDSDSDSDSDGRAEHRDWAWVEEWRSEQEPTPWSTGLVLTAFSALVVGVAIWVLCAGLADRPVIAVLVNLLVAAGLAPAMWLSRALPVLRWIAAGAVLGVVGGWVAAVLMLPLPLP